MMKARTPEELKQVTEDYFDGVDQAGERDYNASDAFQAGQGRGNLTLAQNAVNREEVLYTDPEYYQYYLYQWPK
jgi:hypothetical protein